MRPPHEEAGLKIPATHEAVVSVPEMRILKKRSRRVKLVPSSVWLEEKYFKWPNSDTDFMCAQSHKEDCDTSIVADIVAFVNYEPNVAQKMLFAYSDTGIFTVNKLFPHMTDDSRVFYFPVSRWFEVANEKRFHHGITYGEWALGASCSACPSTSMKITITDSEAKMNKERFEHAFSIGIKVPEAHIASASYGFKSIKEYASTLTSGRGTTITCTCNGFYTYYWTITIGSWGGMAAGKVPVPRFYCTDWPIKPICLPRINDMSEDDLKNVCKGDDHDTDFCGESAAGKEATYHHCMLLKPDKKKQAWWSKHQGRPRPIKVVGQDTDATQQKELLIRKPPPPLIKIFHPRSSLPVIPEDKAVASAHYIDVRDDLMDEYATENGIFDNVVFNDEQVLTISFILLAVFIGCMCWISGSFIGCFVAKIATLIGDNDGILGLFHKYN
eukprot:2130_1